MTNRLRALWILPVLGLFSCGGGGVVACGGGAGGGGPSVAPSRSPTANFAFVCSDLACDLTSTSSDEDVGAAITTYTWSFGDGSVGSAAANPSHTFAAGGTYDVS